MLAAVAVLVVPWSAPLKPVTIEIPATSIQKLAEQIAERSGVKLYVQPRLASEVVTVAVHDMPVESLLDRLAFVLHAEVERHGDSFAIARPSSLQAKLEREELADRVSGLRKFLDPLKAKHRESASERAKKLISILRKRDADTRAQRAAGRLPYFPDDDVTPLSPARVLTEDLALLVGEEAAAIPNHGSATYSNNPVEGQLRFAAGAENSIAEFAEGEAALVSSPIELDDPMSASYGFRTIFRGAELPGGIGKITLEIHRLDDWIRYELSVYNKAGDLRAYDGMSDPNRRNRMALARAAKSATPDLASRTEDETALTVIEDPKWKARGVLSQSLAEIVSNPERVDPIELHGGRTLRAIGTKQGVDVVACLSDLTPLAYEAALEGPKIDRNAFAAALQKAMDTEIATDQGVLTARPKKPVETEENRVSRPVLGTYLRKVLKDRKEDILDLGRLHFEAGWPAESSPILRPLAALFEHLVIQRHPQATRRSHEFLSLVGAFGLGMQTAAPSRMSEAQIAVLEAWLKNRKLQNGGPKPIPQLYLQTAEAFPGPLRSGILTLSTDDLPTAKLAKDPFPDHAEPFLDAQAMGKQLASWTASTGRKYDEATLDAKEYLFGRRHRVTFQFRFANELYRTESLESTEIDTSLGTVPFSKLPETFRKAVWQAYDSSPD